MKDDYNGITNNSRDGQHEEPSDYAEKIEATHGKNNHSPDGRFITDEREGQTQPDEIVAVLNKIGVTSSWSGLLPRPEQFNRYNDSVQDKIVAWNDAMILDESKRQDKIVNAEIKQGNLASIFTFVFNTIVILSIFIAFIITENPNVFWGLTVQGASVVANVVIHIKDKEDKKE